MNRPTGRLRAVLLFTCMCVGVVGARSGSAQTAGYVAVTGFGDIRQFSSSTTDFLGATGTTSPDSIGAGGALRIGTFLHPRWSLELGADIATRETVDVEDPFVIQIFPPIPQPDLKSSSSFVTVATMVGFHPPAIRRVQLAYRAGFSFVGGTYRSDYLSYPYPFLTGSLTSYTTSVTNIVDFPNRLPSPTTILPRATSVTRTHNTGALTLGFDAAIEVTGRFSIVPEVRALVFSMPNNGAGVFLIRPGVGIRWRF